MSVTGLKLNLGAGDTEIEDFIPIDRRFGTEAYPLPRYVTSDEVENRSQWRAGTPELEPCLKIAEGTVAEIRASHVLEHFHQTEVEHVLAEWFRVLEPGGLIKIAVPDFDKILTMRAVIEEGAWSANGYTREVAEKWPLYLFGGNVDANDRHGSAFTYRGLRDRLGMAGFVGIQTWEPDNIDTASHPVSLRLMARKPLAEPACSVEELHRAVERIESPSMIGPEEILEIDEAGKVQPAAPAMLPARRAEDEAVRHLPDDPAGPEVNICATMTLPRVGWNDAWGAVLRALSPLNIQMNTMSGAFWDQCMQTLFEQAVGAGVDWILSIDYDSLFSAKHVDRLIGHLGENSHIDAIAALQCRRAKAYPLCTIKGKNRLEFGGGPQQVDTAHFGLTLIRTEDLKQVPRPWFHGQPGKDGSWTHWSRLDADIYFWHKWREAGKTVFVAPDVSIGHLELMVAEFDEHGDPRHVRVNEWINREGCGVRQSV